MAKSKEIILPSKINPKIAATAIANLLGMDIDARFVSVSGEQETSGGIYYGQGVLAYHKDSIVGYDEGGVPVTFGDPCFQILRSGYGGGECVVGVSNKNRRKLTDVGIIQEYKRIVSNLKD